MSRCFPLNGGEVKKQGVLGDTLSVPIELQKERLRNHDTEKRKQSEREESKETSHKCRDVVHGRTIRLVTKRSQAKKFGNGDMPDGKKDDDHMMRISKSKEDSCESVLSEEHGQPISPTSIFSVFNVSKSEESKAASQPFVEKRGSIIRIRLKPHKQPVPETSLAEPPAILVSSTVPDSRLREAHCEVASTSGLASLEPAAVPPCSEGLFLEPESQYDSLLDQWVPASLNVKGDTSDDLDWILGPDQTGERCSKRQKPADKGRLLHNSFSSFSWPPRANYLQDAEIYALPYINLF
ncbi:hypothetical protein MLD38_002144 [Melastoma candidum]|uniref:Uncharacterized protein n=1 Tax=Melastoma candidum TaxID=119954 RepID=A0ACB9SEZ5_9MYRT|nr:hypothetical protein MLD38_002144 [Melastoma candidum]